MSVQVTARPPPRLPIRQSRRHGNEAQHHEGGHHSPALSWRETLALVVEGIAGGALVLGVLLLIYLVGSPTSMFDRMFDPKARMSDGTEPAPPPRHTTLYTNYGNGKLLVREIDAESVRIRGTISKQDADIAMNMYRDPRRMGIDPNADATARLNAFSNTFK
jgi:hypothetical protein